MSDVCDPTKPILIPRLANDGGWDHKEPGPGWYKVVDSDGNPLKPLVKCKCGTVSGIGLHHVHADGRVTASYFDATAAQLAGMGPKWKGRQGGCGWHVFIKLMDYDLGEFPPKRAE